MFSGMYFNVAHVVTMSCLPAGRELTSVMGAVAYICCVLLVLFATVSIHRVSHFINATMMTIALPSAMIVMFRGRNKTVAADSDKKTQ